MYHSAALVSFNESDYKKMRKINIEGTDNIVNFSIEKSTINMKRDVISSGEEVSGTLFTTDYYTSSYSNGNLIRE